jgi:hypothetical protein
MFFRRPKPKVLTFAEKTDRLRGAGFAIENMSDGRIRIIKNGVASIVGDEGKNEPCIDRAGILMGSEIGALLSTGYQVFFETPTGKRIPAQAEQLKALHDFEDDVMQTLGISNLYNTALGTTNFRHAYDRVAQRYVGGKAQPKPWDKKPVVKA